MLAKLKSRLTNYQIIAMIILTLIFAGGFLLWLPISSKAREFTPFINSLFTSTSALCVTGLVIYDTYAHWSLFGQIVILILIQIGGVGFMTIMATFAMVIGRRLSLHTKVLFIQSTGNNSVATTNSLLKQVILGTLIIESLGAVVLSIRFIPLFGFWEGAYVSIFHSVSAFCNAGFDLMGRFGEFGSLTHFVADPLVNLTIAFLIIVGGIGFLVWNDVIIHKFRLSRYSLNSKIVLLGTTLLLTVGTVLFYIFERKASLAGLDEGTKVLAAFFEAVTPRTAGFNTVDLTTLSESGRALTVVFMLIGGSPGSTAGGIKTTTFFVLLLSIVAQIKMHQTAKVFKRRLEENVFQQAMAITAIYLLGILVASTVMCALQPFTMEQAVFEATSAIGTVGLTLGITPSLCVASKIIIMALMFGGRVGMLSLAMIFSTKQKTVALDRPEEKIIIG